MINRPLYQYQLLNVHKLPWGHHEAESQYHELPARVETINF